MRDVGLGTLSPRLVLDAFIGAGSQPRSACVQLYAERFKKVNTVKGQWSFLDWLDRSGDINLQNEKVFEAISVGTGLESGKQDMVFDTSLDAIETVVLDVIGDVLGHAGESSKTQDGFAAGAFDSLSAVEFSNKLGETLGISLPATLVYDYPSVTLLTRYVHSLSHVDGGDGVQQAVKLKEGGARGAIMSLGKRDGDPVVVVRVHMATRHPLRSFPEASADDRGIRNGLNEQPGFGDCVSLVPLDRWDLDAAGLGSGYQGINRKVRFGSWISDVALFDPESFMLTASETMIMDPQHRMLLEVSSEALSEFGWQHMVQETGVFVGIQHMEYGALSSMHGTSLGAFSATSSPLSVACGRMAFTYGFTGPALSIDTACSSTMVALHSGMNHMLFNRSSNGREATIVCGGVNLTLSERTTSAAHAAGMLTLDGRCKTLDAKADGYVRAESCTIFILDSKPPDAMDETQDGGKSSIVLRGTCVNQDGRSSSLTAPNGPAQQRVLHGALEACGLLAHEVNSLEMHGTGTALGDPIEIGAATHVFIGKTPRSGRNLVLSAAKSHIGHAEAAAGGVGVAHAVAQLSNQRLHQILHLSRLNPYVVSALSHLSANEKPLILRQNAPSILNGHVSSHTMGISSFAFQGTNAHAVLARTQAGHAQQFSSTTHHWHTTNKLFLWYTAPSHHLVHRYQPGLPTKAIYHIDLSRPGLSYLHDHQVAEKPLFPAAALIEMVMACVHTTLVEGMTRRMQGLKKVTIHAPLSLPKKPGQLKTILNTSISHELGRFEVCSISGSQSTELLHMSGDAFMLGDQYSVRKLRTTSTPVKSLQQRMFDAFIEQARKTICVAVPAIGELAVQRSRLGPQAVGSVDTSSTRLAAQSGGYAIQNPAIIDSSTHLIISLEQRDLKSTTTRVPVALQSVVPLCKVLAKDKHRGPGGIPALGRIKTAIEEGSIGSDFLLTDCAQIVDFQVKPFGSRHFALGGAQARQAGHSSQKIRVSSHQRVKDIAEKLLNVTLTSEQPLMEVGMDSLSAMELRTLLNEAFALDLPATVSFDYPNVAALSTYVDLELEEYNHAVSIDGHRGLTGANEIEHQQVLQVLTHETPWVAERVKRIVASTLGRNPPVDQPLMEAGMDSLSATELRSGLEQAFSLELPATITFDYPTTTALTKLVDDLLDRRTIEKEISNTLIQRKALTQPTTSTTGDSIPKSTAIIGMAARYPEAKAGDWNQWPGSNQGFEAFSFITGVAADLPRRIPLQVRE